MSLSTGKKSILGEFGDKIISIIKDALCVEHSKAKKYYADTIVRNSEGEILLLQRTDIDDFMPGKWSLPGGKIEEGEDPYLAAKRELEEETGLDLECVFIKKVDKPDCEINYFEAILDNEQLIVLDNEEHYRYEFVKFDHLSKYDLILDLGLILNEILPSLPAINFPVQNNLTIEEISVVNSTPLSDFEINKAFDEGLILEDDYLLHIQRLNALELLFKAYDNNQLNTDQFFDALEKAKHFDFVQVNRDGKVFYQYREIGTNKMESDLSEGDTFDTGELGLRITKYSDKSFLITGDTYKNLELLRGLKSQLGGYGSWNKTLGGWVFPSYGKEKIMATLASKMSVETIDDQIEKNAALNLKNSIDVGTKIKIDGEIEEVTTASTNESGEVEYGVKGEENKEQGSDKKDGRGRKEVPVGTISKDGKFIKVAGGWQYIKKKVTEKEAAIAPVDETKATQLINEVTEESRFKTTKMIFGKESEETSVKDEVENRGKEKIEIVTKKFVTRSGEEIEALDLTVARGEDIQLADPESVLDKEKPYYIPDINEFIFSGGRDDRFIFDYVKMGDGNFLVALNGFKDSYTFNSNPRYKKVEPAYAVMSLDNLVATTEFYKTKRRAEIKRDTEELNEKYLDKVKNLTPEQISTYKPYSYSRLSAAQKKKYPYDVWENLPIEEKLKEVPKMASPVYAFKGVKRIKPLDDNTMLHSNFEMYKIYVDKDYKTPRERGQRGYTSTDPCAIEYNEVREQIKWKKNDLEIQREENGESYKKGLETSYGDSGTSNELLESHGVKIKLQNGKEMTVDKAEQIKESLSHVYSSFGDRSSMAKNFGLKISHSGDKMMFARKALGIYYPSMRAIGVSDNQEHGKFGFTLAHEFAHFIDNYAGNKVGKNYASDDYNSTAGQIANLFRKNQNKISDSNYLNRTCECFARAMEQYHAMKTMGEDAIKSKAYGLEYHKHDEHVSKDIFNSTIKPLIETFLSENDQILKSLVESIEFDGLIKANDSFELIKSAFDENLITEDEFTSAFKKYNLISKGDPSHGGKLVSKKVTDKTGKTTTKWVKNSEDDKDGSKDFLESTKHSKSVLAAFAKETPLSELKRVINESHDEKLRAAAQAEIARREAKEKVKIT